MPVDFETPANLTYPLCYSYDILASSLAQLTHLAPGGWQNFKTAFLRSWPRIHDSADSAQPPSMSPKLVFGHLCLGLNHTCVYPRLNHTCGLIIRPLPTCPEDLHIMASVGIMSNSWNTCTVVNKLTLFLHCTLRASHFSRISTMHKLKLTYIFHSNKMAKTWTIYKYSK